MSAIKGNKGYIPNLLTSIIMILIVMIYVQFVSCDPVRDNPISSGSHSDSHSGDGSWSVSWSNPDTSPSSSAAHSRQKRFCFLIFWLCTGGEGGSGGGGGGGGGGGAGGAPGAPGGRF